ncbi:cytochrome c-type biogenesis protein [Sulfurirhabdus autotrophica]|uniref:Cytochrome c-type biogenesis protein n=1 Tax=Sulfurirhabdus autotrophica TaxID=1706046 RepID=A0A4R3YCG4_9PROT|nr:cytochrome c-type biogenesis protein [Sulfurirhabdus autotrophica]TCV89502.1 cytochrome c-type biogenesis protein CcmH [Sulfurirhabdus autotrophica]
MKHFLLILFFLPVIAFAKEAEPLAENPEVEARMMALANELRCLVCQNQTLADSHSDLAGDLRREMRGMAEKGMSDKEIVAFMVSRYGDFVLYRPPLNAKTLALWFGPFVLLIGVGLMLVRYLKTRRQRLAAQGQLSEDDHKKAEALLQNNGEQV